MVLTDDHDLYQRLLTLRDHGMSRHQRYLHIDLGFNYRMTNMQAAIGLAQLEQIELIYHRRNRQMEHYNSRLKEIDGVRLRPMAEWCDFVHWMMTIQLEDPAMRDRLISFLKERNIDCRPMIFPVHEAEHFSGKYDLSKLKVSSAISKSCI